MAEIASSCVVTPMVYPNIRTGQCASRCGQVPTNVSWLSQPAEAWAPSLSGLSECVRFSVNPVVTWRRLNRGVTSSDSWRFPELLGVRRRHEAIQGLLSPARQGTCHWAHILQALPPIEANADGHQGDGETIRGPGRDRTTMNRDLA